jgi:hypothetical protein
MLRSIAAIVGPLKLHGRAATPLSVGCISPARLKFSEKISKNLANMNAVTIDVICLDGPWNNAAMKFDIEEAAGNG